MENAKIVDTHLGIEDHGILTAYIFLEGNGWGGGFGGYPLGGPAASSWIVNVLKCAGVEKWEDLKGRYIRGQAAGPGSTVVHIAHILDDDIEFDAAAWAKQLREVESK